LKPSDKVRNSSSPAKSLNYTFNIEIGGKQELEFAILIRREMGERDDGG